MNFLGLIKRFICEKAYFFKILFSYIFVKNVFINLLLGAIIYLLKDTSILGPFVSAVLTFNLINSYSYYLKEKNWNKAKEAILHDTHLFISLFLIFLRKNYIPISEKNTDRRNHLDEDFDSIIPKNADDYYKLFVIYEKYYFELLTSDDIEFEFDEKHLHGYIDLFRQRITQLNQNVLMATVLFYENKALINGLSEFIRAVNSNIEFSYNSDNPVMNKIFLTNLLYLITNIKGIIKLVM